MGVKQEEGGKGSNDLFYVLATNLGFSFPQILRFFGHPSLMFIPRHVFPFFFFSGTFSVCI